MDCHIRAALLKLSIHATALLIFSLLASEVRGV